MNRTREGYYWERECLTRLTAIIQSIFCYQQSVDYEKTYNYLKQMRDEKANDGTDEIVSIYNFYIEKHIKELHQVLSNELTKNYYRNCQTSVFRTIECIKYADSNESSYSETAKEILLSIMADADANELFVSFPEYGKCVSPLISKEFMDNIGTEVESLLLELEEGVQQISSGTLKAIVDYMSPDFVKISSILMWYFAINDRTVDRRNFARACSLYETFTILELYIPSKNEYLHVCPVEEILAKSLHAKSAGVSSEEVIGWVNGYIEYCQKSGRYDLLYVGLETLLSGLCWMGSYNTEKEVFNIMALNSITMSEFLATRYRFLDQMSKIKDREWSFDFAYNVRFGNEDQDRLIYDYNALSMSDTQINDHFNMLSAEIRTETNGLVVFEWSRNININPRTNWNINDFQSVLSEVLTEEIDACMSCRVIEASVLNGDFLEWEDVIYISNKTKDSRFPWLGFIVTADRVTRKKMNVAIYAIYLPKEDFVNESELVIKNNLLQQRYLSIKNSKNPKVKNYIQTIQLIILEEMEKYLNSESNSESIY